MFVLKVVENYNRVLQRNLDEYIAAFVSFYLITVSNKRHKFGSKIYCTPQVPCYKETNNGIRGLFLLLVSNHKLIFLKKILLLCQVNDALAS